MSFIAQRGRSWRSLFRGARAVCLSGLFVSVNQLGCGYEPLSRVDVEGVARLGAAPVVGAEVTVRHRWGLAGEHVEPPITSASTTTDEEGRFSLHLTATAALFDITVSGGRVRALAGGPSGSSGASTDGGSAGYISLSRDDRLRTVVGGDDLFGQPTVVVSPFTTIAAAWAEGPARYAAEQRAIERALGAAEGGPAAGSGQGTHVTAQLGTGDGVQRAYERYELAYERFRVHLGVASVRHAALSGPGEPGADEGEAERHQLLLAGFERLAARVGELASLAPDESPEMALVLALSDDVTEDMARFDGVMANSASEGGDGAAGAQIQLGSCLPVAQCTSEQGGLFVPRCVCRLDANTLRFDLAQSVVEHFYANSGDFERLTSDDVSKLARDLAESSDLSLFGEQAALAFDGDAPTLEILPSRVADERSDNIQFDELFVPHHESSTSATVDVNIPGACPRVFKHTHRMIDADDNPIHWRVVARDQQALIYRVEYRLRRRGQSEWMTEWIAAEPLPADDSDGREHRAVATRALLPELASEFGDFEVELRAIDTFLNQSAAALRCWNHNPIAAPLWVGDIDPATGAGSIESLSLGDTNNLAPLLEGGGTSIDGTRSDKVIASLDVRNGTDDPVYLDVNVALSDSQYQASWVISSARLTPRSDNSSCGGGACQIGPGCDKPTIQSAVSGLLDPSSVQVRVIDADNAGDGPLPPCERCEPGVVEIAPRLGESQPSRYIVQFVLTDLSSVRSEYGTRIDDLDLHSELSSQSITGTILEDAEHCAHQDPPGLCVARSIFRRYLALKALRLEIDRVEVSGDLYPSSDISVRVGRRTSAPNTFDLLRSLNSREWSVDENSLPTFFPAIDDCP